MIVNLKVLTHGLFLIGRFNVVDMDQAAEMLKEKFSEHGVSDFEFKETALKGQRALKFEAQSLGEEVSSLFYDLAEVEDLHGDPATTYFLVEDSHKPSSKSYEKVGTYSD